VAESLSRSIGRKVHIGLLTLTDLKRLVGNGSCRAKRLPISEGKRPPGI